LPLGDGRKHLKVFISLGWSFRSRHKNHFVLTHPDHPDVYVSIPDHDEVKKQTLKAILRDAGISDRDYRKAFDRL
jgi:predicted RNA binding protein YcfA (HicA-like mRNA interferase family)